MMITNKIRMDLQQPKTTPLVSAVQTDRYCRNLEISLFSGKVPFLIPEGAAVLIHFRKSSGKGGVYDTLPDGAPAWSAKRNILTLALAPQVLTSPGEVSLTVSLVLGSAQLNSFLIRLNVEPLAKPELEESRAYFHIVGFPELSAGAEAGQFLRVRSVDAGGRVTGLEAAEPESGKRPRLSIGTVETLDAGADATAAIRGTAEEPVLDLGIPRGEDGTAVRVPDYWLAALEAGAEAINTALCEAGRNKSTFLFYSDAHWNYGSQMSPSLLKYLHRNTGMTRTFFGGDIVNDEAADYDTMAYLWQWRKQLKDLPNHHSVVGNHDDGNATDRLFSEQYVYGYLLAAEETPDMVRGEGMYYYIDSPAEKTRYLCLDTAYKGLDDGQTAFVTDALQSTPDGWHVVAVAHIWVDADYSVSPAVPGDISADGAALLALFDRYNARGSGFEDCGGQVEFCVGGHTHWDYDTTSPSGIPVILVETDSRHVRSGLGFTAGTTTEASVSGIVADYDAKKVSVIRVGRGTSREVEISITTSEVPAYTNVLPISLAADGVSVYNADDTPGYKADTRWSSSGQAEQTQSGTYLSGWIRFGPGDVIRLKNVTMIQSAGTTCVFLSDAIGSTKVAQNGTNINTYYSPTWDSEGNLVQFTVPSSSSYSWLRIQCAGFTAESIVTINELIV